MTNLLHARINTTQKTHPKFHQGSGSSAAFSDQPLNAILSIGADGMGKGGVWPITASLTTLPACLRSTYDNRIKLGIIPGAYLSRDGRRRRRKPALHPYLKVVVGDINQLTDEGHFIEVPGRPDPVLQRAMVSYVIADMPGMAALMNRVGHMSPAACWKCQQEFLRDSSYQHHYFADHRCCLPDGHGLRTDPRFPVPNLVPRPDPRQHAELVRQARRLQEHAALKKRQGKNQTKQEKEAFESLQGCHGPSVLSELRGFDLVQVRPTPYSQSRYYATLSNAAHRTPTQDCMIDAAHALSGISSRVLAPLMNGQFKQATPRALRPKQGDSQRTKVGGVHCKRRDSYLPRAHHSTPPKEVKKIRKLSLNFRSGIFGYAPSPCCCTCC